MNNKNIFWFVSGACFLIWLGSIQSGKLSIGGGSYWGDSTNTVTLNNALLVNGQMKTNDADIILPDSYQIRMGDQSSYPSVGINGQINEIVAISNAFQFHTVTNTNNVATLDSADGLDLHYGKIFIRDSIQWAHGSGTPNGSVSAPAGSLYSRVNAVADSNLYVKTSNSSVSTGWIPVK